METSQANRHRAVPGLRRGSDSGARSARGMETSQANRHRAVPGLRRGSDSGARSARGWKRPKPTGIERFRGCDPAIRVPGQPRRINVAGPTGIEGGRGGAASIWRLGPRKAGKPPWSIGIEGLGLRRGFDLEGPVKESRKTSPANQYKRVRSGGGP